MRKYSGTIIDDGRSMDAEVCLASDVESRIADLERALHQIKNGCVDEGDTINEWYRSAPSELRKIAETALAGGPVP